MGENKIYKPFVVGLPFEHFANPYIVICLLRILGNGFECSEGSSKTNSIYTTIETNDVTGIGSDNYHNE